MPKIRSPYMCPTCNRPYDETDAHCANGCDSEPTEHTCSRCGTMLLKVRQYYVCTGCRSPRNIFWDCKVCGVIKEPGSFTASPFDVCQGCKKKMRVTQIYYDNDAREVRLR